MPEYHRDDPILRRLVDDAAMECPPHGPCALRAPGVDGVDWRAQALEAREAAQHWATEAHLWHVAYRHLERNTRAAWTAAVVFCSLWLIETIWRWLR